MMHCVVDCVKFSLPQLTMRDVGEQKIHLDRILITRGINIWSSSLRKKTFFF